MNLKDKVAIITGGSGGLGKCICNALAKQGVNLAILYNNHYKDAQVLSDELNANGCLTSTYKCDVTNPDDPVHMFTILNDIKGPGLARGVKVWQTTLNASNVIETNLTDYDYAMAIETTTLSSDVASTSDGPSAALPVVDANPFSSSGYVTVTRGDGSEENIYYASKSGNNLLDLT